MFPQPHTPGTTFKFNVLHLSLAQTATRLRFPHYIRSFLSWFNSESVSCTLLIFDLNA